MARVSNCHEGYCKPSIDQVEYEIEPELEVDLPSNACGFSFGRPCTHLYSEGREWCKWEPYHDDQRLTFMEITYMKRVPVHEMFGIE